MGIDTEPATTRARRDNAEAVAEWTKFLDRCLSQRTDPDIFASYVSVLSSQNPLPPAAVADMVLKPQPRNQHSLDPRMTRYLTVLTEQKLIDTPSVLNALYKFSTSHTQAEAAGHPPSGAASRWKSSCGPEETIFYRLTKAVGLGTGIRSAREAIEVCKIMAKWMTLFTSAAAAFSQDVLGQVHSAQSRDDMETSRAAFVMLLLATTENQKILQALSQPFAHEARKAMSESLTSFVPSIVQSASQIADRLEYFRTTTLAGFEPVDKKNEDEHAQIDDIITYNSNMAAIDSLVLPEVPLTNSRAGLYIYLNALVGPHDAGYFVLGRIAD